jgi:hypothetical protein
LSKGYVIATLVDMMWGEGFESIQIGGLSSLHNNTVISERHHKSHAGNPALWSLVKGSRAAISGVGNEHPRLAWQCNTTPKEHSLKQTVKPMKAS